MRQLNVVLKSAMELVIDQRRKHVTNLNHLLKKSAYSLLHSTNRTATKNLLRDCAPKTEGGAGFRLVPKRWNAKEDCQARQGKFRISLCTRS